MRIQGYDAVEILCINHKYLTLYKFRVLLKFSVKNSELIQGKIFMINTQNFNCVITLNTHEEKLSNYR
jgi:hypothetical protein